MNYVYKRLRFLNNKHISQLSALAFLAVWHGFYVGYFVSFTQEFFVFFIEAQVNISVSKFKATSSCRPPVSCLDNAHCPNH